MDCPKKVGTQISGLLTSSTLKYLHKLPDSSNCTCKGIIKYIYWTFSVFSQYVYCTNWLQETNYGLQLQASEVTTFCFLETTFCFLLTDKLVYWSVESSFLVSRRQSLNLYKRLQHSQVSLQLKREFLQFLKELCQVQESNPCLHE